VSRDESQGLDKDVTSVQSRDLHLDSTQNGGYDGIVPQEL